MKNVLIYFILTAATWGVAWFIFNATPTHNFLLFALCTFSTLALASVGLAYFILTMINLINFINKE
jgi:hypothetical protein